MTLYIEAEDKYRYLRWAAPKCNIVNGVWKDDTYALAVLEAQPDGLKRKDDPIRAVFLMNMLDGAMCHVHYASDESGGGWLTRNILAGLFGYVFKVRQMRLLRAEIPAHNRRALIVALKMGYQIEGRLRGSAADGSDVIALSMSREDCIWIGE